jgi:hypothetical protein
LNLLFKISPIILKFRPKNEKKKFRRSGIVEEEAAENEKN